MAIKSFESFGVGRVIFGRGKRTMLPELSASLGRRALVIHNGPPPKVDADAVVHRQRGEPTVADVDAAVEVARAEGCDHVIAIGGGSAIDAGKAVAGLMGNGGSAVDYMEVVGLGKRITRPAAPWIAVPTTAGTGAEATRNAVIGLPEKKFKASIRSELLLPRIALIDPELGVDVPANVTAASGMDAICQLIEALTSTGATPVTDALALRGLALAAPAIERAVIDGSDVESREAMALAAYLSGVCLTSAGLGAVHGFAAPLGANFPVPHGVVCARLLPLVMEANVIALMREGKPVERYAAVARMVAGVEYVDGGLAVIRELVHALAIPGLGQFGVREEHVSEMVALAKKASSMKFNPVVLEDEQLAEILRKAI
jgi:alcohol dehydrogenase class IV